MSRFQFFFYLATILATTTCGAFGKEENRSLLPHRNLGSGYYQIREKSGNVAPTDDYSTIEQALMKENQVELANLARELRLQNPYPVDSTQYRLWWEQAQFNIPILILSSIFLDEMCRKENIKKILFSQRDCYHWIKIFKKLFPDYDSIDFMTSRKAYLDPSLEYVQYVRNLCQDKFIIADGQGSGKTCLAFFKKNFQFQPLHLAIVRFESACPGIIYVNECSHLEMVNCAPYGTLRVLTSHGPVRSNPEYPLKYVMAAQACVDRAIEQLGPGRFRVFNQAAIEMLLDALNKYKPVLMHYHDGVSRR